MKINLKNSKNQLSRDEMRTIVAGSSASFANETAQLLCKDNKEFEIAECAESVMIAKCANHGGVKICSGGGN